MKLILVLLGIEISKSVAYGAQKDPYAYIEEQTHAKRILWCGFLSKVIIEPFCSSNEQGVAITFNVDRYLTMLNEFLLTKIEGEDIVNTRRYVPHSQSFTLCFAPCF